MKHFVWIWLSLAATCITPVCSIQAEEDSHILTRQSLTVPPVALVNAIRERTGVLGLHDGINGEWIRPQDVPALRAILFNAANSGVKSMYVTAFQSSFVRPESNVMDETKKIIYSIKVGRYPLRHNEEAAAMASTNEELNALLLGIESPPPPSK